MGNKVAFLSGRAELMSPLVAGDGGLMISRRGLWPMALCGRVRGAAYPLPESIGSSTPRETSPAAEPI